MQLRLPIWASTNVQGVLNFYKVGLRSIANQVKTMYVRH